MNPLNCISIAMLQTDINDGTKSIMQTVGYWSELFVGSQPDYMYTLNLAAPERRWDTVRSAMYFQRLYFLDSTVFNLGLFTPWSNLLQVGLF